MATRRTAIDLSTLSDGEGCSADSVSEMEDESSGGGSRGSETGDEDDACDGGRHECDSGCEEARYHRDRQCRRSCDIDHECDSGCEEDSDDHDHECESACEEDRYHRSGEYGHDCCGARRETPAEIRNRQLSSLTEAYMASISAAHTGTAQRAHQQRFYEETHAFQEAMAAQQARGREQADAVRRATAAVQVRAAVDACTAQQARLAQQAHGTQVSAAQLRAQHAQFAQQFHAQQAQQARAAQQARVAQQSHSAQQTRAAQQARTQQFWDVQQVRAQQTRAAQQARAQQEVIAQQARDAQQVRIQQARAAQEARVAQQMRLIQQGASPYSTATTSVVGSGSAASTGVAIQHTMTETHVKLLVDSYRRCLTEYARANRVIEFIPLVVWQQVLTAFQRGFPALNQAPSILKAYLRRGLGVDPLAPAPPRSAAASLMTTARLIPTTTAATGPRSTSAVTAKPEIVPATVIQPRQASASNGTESARPQPSVIFNANVKSERIDTAAPTSTSSVAAPVTSLRSTAALVTSHDQVLGSEHEALTLSLTSPTTVVSQQGDAFPRIASISPVGTAGMSIQLQEEQRQRRLKRRQKMEEQLELQELKKQKLILENLKLTRELGLITEAQCLEMGRRAMETWE